jgi:hypothetical protein
MIYLIIFIIILAFIYINYNFTKKFRIHIKNIFEDNIPNKEKFQNTKSADKISQKEIDNIMKYGFLPSNYNENTDFTINQKISNLEDLKEKENKTISKYLIFNRINEMKMLNENVFRNLDNTNNITEYGYNVLTNNTLRSVFLDQNSSTLGNYNTILQKNDIMDYTENEFKFLLNLLYSNNHLTSTGLRVLLSSKMLKNLKIYKLLRDTYLNSEGKYVIGEEEIEEEFDENSLYALNYHNSPNFNEKLYKLQSDKYPEHRRFIPPNWKCQNGDITRVNNKEVVESNYIECHSHIPLYDEFNYYKYLDELE